ncbi:MAG: TldD/PmbA family protein [Trueperaceae bacterium]|nr:MAG: TldD/PmbA family protein [Trueperaceae bacterium]
MTFEQAKTVLVQRATERGVEAEVLATSGRELTLSAADGRVDEITSATRGGVGVRVVHEGRIGYASSEALDEASLAWVLDEAIENAALQSARGAVLVEGHALGRSDLIGEGLSAPVERKAEAVTTLESALSADERVDAIAFARYSESESEAVLGSTRGADGGYRNGYAMLMASPIMRQGESVKQGYEIDFGKEFHAMDPTRTSQRILEKVGRHLGATPLPTGRYATVFEPEVVATILQLLLFSLSGKTLAEGKSRLAQRLGQPIASERFTLVDDPTLENGLASRPFDAEGTPASRTVVIERGVLRSFLHNSDTARRTGQANTGHASRSYASTLGVGATNLMLEAGEGVVLDDGVIVTNLMGVHAGANPISGDVSVQGLGLRVEGGESRPVENFALSFNLFRLLERIEAVGAEVQWRPAGGAIVGARSLQVDALSFAGA